MCIRDRVIEICLSWAMESPPGRRGLERTVRGRTACPETPRCPCPSCRPSCAPSLMDSLDLIDSGWGRFGQEDPTHLVDGQDVLMAVSAPLSPPPVELCAAQDRPWSWLETYWIFTWSPYLVINGGPAGSPP